MLAYGKMRKEVITVEKDIIISLYCREFVTNSVSLTQNSEDPPQAVAE